MLLMLARVLVVARLLDPYGFGQYSAGLLVSSTFTMLACVGLQPMLYRELPMLMVRRRERAGTVLLVQCIVVACACAGVAMLVALAGVSVAGLSTGLLLASLFHGLSQQVFLVASADTRSRGLPLAFASQSLMRAVGALGLGAAVAFLTGSPALSLLAEALASLVLAYLAVSTLFRRAGVSGAAIYRLAARRLPKLRWRSALWLCALGIVAFVVANVDRWIAAERLTPDRFAQYAFAWIVLLVAQSLQFLINASVFPLLARRFSQVGAASTYRMCGWISCVLLGGGAILGLPSWWIADAVIGRWFHEYRGALEVMPLFMAVAVLRVSDFWTSFLVIARQEGRLLLLNVAGGVGAAVIWGVGVLPYSGGGTDLWPIALLSLLLTAINYLTTTIAAWRAAFK